MRAQRPRCSRLLGLFCAALLLPTNAGCSLMLTRPPPRDRPLQHHDQCTDNAAPAVLDFLVGGSSASIGLLALMVGAAQREAGTDRRVPSWEVGTRGAPGNAALSAGIMFSVAGAALIGSGLYGTRSSRACRAARQDLHGRNLRIVEEPEGVPLPAP